MATKTHQAGSSTVHRTSISFSWTGSNREELHKGLHSRRACQICHSLLTILQAMGAAFTVETPDNPLVCVTSEQHINELEQAPEDHFSLHAIAKDVGLLSLQWPGNLMVHCRCSSRSTQ